MRPRVALTGASGFLGSAVHEALRGCDADVLKLGRNADSAVPFDLDAEFFPTELPASLVHLAWAGLPAYDDDIHLRQVPRHLAFLEAAIAAGVRDVTITGTCFEYGMREGCLGESLPAAPAANNLYAQAKDLLHREARALCEHHDVGLKWVRVFYIFGPQPRRTLYTQLLAAIAAGDRHFRMSPGDQVRDFIPVAEAAQQIAEIALQQQDTGVFNSCRGRGQSVQEFVEDILREQGATLELDLGYYPYSPFEPHAFWGDPQRMQQAREAYRRERRV